MIPLPLNYGCEPREENTNSTYSLAVIDQRAPGRAACAQELLGTQFQHEWNTGFQFSDPLSDGHCQSEGVADVQGHAPGQCSQYLGTPEPVIPMLSWLQGWFLTWEVDLLLAGAHTRGCGIRVSEHGCLCFQMLQVWDYCLQIVVAWSSICCHRLGFDFC